MARLGVGARTGWLGGILLALALVALHPAHAAARERREILNGAFALTVGFQAEPPYEGQPNAVWVQISDLRPSTPTPAPTPTAAPDGSPTPTPTPAAETKLAVELRFGAQSRKLDLVQSASDATIYRAAFVPTAPGDYVLRITGTVAGQDVAEEFQSGPDTFPGVVGVAGLQFPAQIPVGQGIVDGFAGADQDAERARTFGIVGIALGVVGLFAGGVAIVVARRPPRAPATAEAVAQAAPPNAEADDRA